MGKLLNSLEVLHVAPNRFVLFILKFLNIKVRIIFITIFQDKVNKVEAANIFLVANFVRVVSNTTSNSWEFSPW